MGVPHYSTIALLLCAFLALMPLLYAETFETGDNSTVDGCSNHCTYHDTSISCWNKTLNFFEHILLSQIRNYVVIQINIDQWRRRNVQPYSSDFNGAKRRSIHSMSSHLQRDDFVSTKAVSSFVTAMIDLAAHKSNKTLSWMPHFTCPIPCEYRSVVWRNLFIASSILNVCLFIAVLPLIRQMTTNDASEALIVR